jgi:hypothetical protein
MKMHIDNPVFACALTAAGELEIAYLSPTGSIELFNVRKWQEGASPPVTLYSNPALRSNALNLVSMAKQQDKIGLVFTDRAILARVNSGSLIFPFNEFAVSKEDPVAKSESKSKYRNFYRLGFVEDTLFFYDRARLLLLSLTEPQFEIRHLSLTSLLVESKNGFRLLDEHTFIFRVIRRPMYFILVDKEEVALRILKNTSDLEREDYGHFKELAGVYDSFMDKKPIEVQHLQSVSERVTQVWEAVMEIASLYIDPGEQLMALRFANFLLSYFRFTTRCRTMLGLAKELRVVNSLRHESLNRWITYQ